MKILQGNEKLDALNFMNLAAEVALKAKCERSKCGSVIVKGGKVIGYGSNSPAGGEKKRCHTKKHEYNKKVTDKTCCIHAEQRAILKALERFPEELKGSRLYFIRLDKENNPSRAKEPYCTICSKLALDTGIGEFVLWHEEGITVYNTKEYNELSFKYSG